MPHAFFFISRPEKKPFDIYFKTRANLFYKIKTGFIPSPFIISQCYLRNAEKGRKFGLRQPSSYFF